MTSEHRLPTPRFKVTMRDGRVLEAQSYNADALAWDRTASKHHWPAAQDAPLTWATFVAWSALRRSGDIDGMTWDDFSEREALAVQTLRAGADEPVSDDDLAPAEVDGVDPTLQAVEVD